MEQYSELIEIENSQRVKSVKISLVAQNCVGTVNVTDIILQGGGVGISWNAHPSEIQWVVNEDE